jgi:hypothetical protein
VGGEGEGVAQFWSRASGSKAVWEQRRGGVEVVDKHQGRITKSVRSLPEALVTLTRPINAPQGGSRPRGTLDASCEVSTRPSISLRGSPRP